MSHTAMVTRAKTAMYATDLTSGVVPRVAGFMIHTLAKVDGAKRVAYGRCGLSFHDHLLSSRRARVVAFVRTTQRLPMPNRLFIRKGMDELRAFHNCESKLGANLALPPAKSCEPGEGVLGVKRVGGPSIIEFFSE